MRTILLGLLLALGLASNALALDGWPATLQGEGMLVQFDAGAAPSGTIRKGEQAYPFTGTVTGDRITGQFKTGAQGFDFSIERAGGKYTLLTGASRIGLVPAAPAQEAQPNPAPNNALPPGAMILEPRALKDPRSTLDVSNVLVPQGWQIDDQIVWQIDKAFFVTAASTIWDPKTGWGVRWIPRDAFNCLPMTYQSAVQQGQSLLTLSGYELTDRVLNTTDYLKQVVLPRYRNIPGVKVVSAEDLPKVAQHYQEANRAIDQTIRQHGHEKQYAAGRMRIEYAGPNNAVFQEDLYCFLELTWSPQANAMAVQAGMPGAQTWNFSPIELYGLVAPKGELEKATPLLHTIYASARITPDWYAYTANIGAMLKLQAQKDLEAILKAKKQITESQHKSWTDMIKQMHKHADQVGHLLANTSSYTNPNDPTKPPTVLPAGGKPYINSQGQIANFPTPPPPGSDWKPMTPVDP